MKNGRAFSGGQQSGLKQKQETLQVRPLQKMKTMYAGVFSTDLASDEVVFIFGNPAMGPHSIQIESRVTVSLKTAKCLAVTLGNLLKRYESENGVVDISGPQMAAEDKHAGPMMVAP